MQDRLARQDLKAISRGVTCGCLRPHALTIKWKIYTDNVLWLNLNFKLFIGYHKIL